MGAKYHEVAQSIQKLSSRKSVGYGELTAEVSKSITWALQILKQTFIQIAKQKAIPKGWMQGVATFPHKQNARGDLNNYRPLTLINAIYKIWAEIMSQRLNTILGLLPEDEQYEYKNKRSTIDILAIVNNHLGNDATQQMILFDFPNASGNIERDILRAKLYGSGLAIEFFHILRIGHEGNKLRRIHW